MKRAYAIVALTGGMFLLPPAAVAAQDPMQDQMAAMMEAVAPDENHQVLEAYKGSWNHALKFYPAPGATPMEMTATSVAEMSMGGRYLVSEFDGSFMGSPFEGRETMGYDKVKGKYFSLWHDNMSTGPMVLWGDWDQASNTLTMEGTVSDPMSGNPEVAVRNTSQILDDATIHYENWGPGPDGEMFKMMEIHSTKQ
ncbi:MAG: DUF1579 domain-containing protein [Gemmatimonadota bacterium]